MKAQISTIETKLILSGLGSTDRRMLSDLLAFLRDESAWKQIIDLFASWMDKAAETITREEKAAVDRLRERLSETANEIETSYLSDDALRLVVWMLLRDSYELPAELTFSHRGASKVTVDLGARMAESYFHNVEADWRSGMPMWMRTTFGKPVEHGTFAQMVEDYVLTQVNSLLEESAVRSDEEREALFNEIWESLSSSEFAVEAGKSSEADKQALIKALTTSGTVGGLAVAVEAAGFSAYILAAQASAVIPLVGGKTLVSLLAVITNPWVVVPVMFYGLNWAKKSSNKSLMTAFGSIAGATLAMSGVNNSVQGIDKMLSVFANANTLLKELRRHENQKGIYKIIDRYENRLSEMKGAAPNELRPWYSETFERPLLEHGASNRTAILLDGLLREDRELIVLSTLTVGDLVYHAAMIDPKVVAAAEYSSTSDIDCTIDFAVFSDRLNRSVGLSLLGSEERLKGYVAEETVIQRLIEKGHVVERPDSASQPGFDLVVDGQPMQVKCRDDLSGVGEHFEKYPDIPVIANAELQPKLESGDYEWASQVYFLEGFTDQHVTEITRETLDAGGELVDLDIPVFAASLAAARNVWGWWKGQIAPEEIAWTTATDVAGKGALSLIGGFAGSAVGLLLIGPAGAVIGGPTGGIFGAGSYRRFKSWSGKYVDAEVEGRVRESATSLASVCIKALEKKSQLIRKKQKYLGKGLASSYADLRFGDEIQFNYERTCDLKIFLDNSEMSLQTLRDGLIASVLRSNTHPSQYQDEMREFLKSFDDLEKVVARKMKDGAGLFCGWVKSIGNQLVKEAKDKRHKTETDQKKGVDKDC